MTSIETGTARTTALMLGNFARELATYDISQHVIDELTIEAGRRLLDGSADLTVKAHV